MRAPRQDQDGAARPVDIYARVSRAGDREMRSTGGQVEACRSVLAGRELPEGQTFIDDGKSAWNPAVVRAGWDRLMGRLESGESGGVVVFDLERFARRPMDGERLIVAAERGFAVFDSDGEFDLTSASGKKSFRDAMAAAAYYSDRLSDRVRRGKRRKAMKGEVDNGGASHRAFGFEPDSITVREPEAAWIRWLAGHVLHGDTQDALTAHMNARGVLTSQGKPWRVTGLREMMLRERNRGNIEHCGVIVARLPGDPILDDATFGRLAAKYAARRPGRPWTRTYLCSGLAACGACGHKLSTRPRQGRRNYDSDGEVAREYWCKKYDGGGRCGTVFIDQRDLDAAAGELAVVILSDPRHASQVEAAAARHEEEAAALDSLIGDAEQTALALAGRLGRGEMDLKRYDAASGPLDRRLADLRGRREGLDAPGVPVIPAGENWARRWAGAEPAERRSLLTMALRGRMLVIGPAGPGGKPDRITIGPRP